MLGGLFDKKKGQASPIRASAPTGPKFPRHSGAWKALRKRLTEEPGLRVADIGYTSPHNINYITSLGHSVFLADLVHDAHEQSWVTGEDGDGKPVYDVDGFLKHTLDFAGRTLDVVLLWAELDYLPEPLLVPVVQRFREAMNPGGQVLAFFHTRMQGDETVHCRFHLTETDDVEVQIAESAALQRAFTNRSIERLFSGWSGHKQFLAKDSVSEVIMTL